MSHSLSPETLESSAEIGRIKGRIETLVDVHFGKGQKSYFLSRLGTDLGDDRLLLEKLTGKKLAQFVRENLAFEIGVGGTHQNVYFLKAPNAAHGAEPVLGTITIPRYVPRFWAAFAVPLQDGEERGINLATLDFGPIATISVEGADVRPIPAEYIAPREASGSAAETAERIANWIASQKLDGTRFYTVARRHRMDGISLLDQMLTALDHDQLRRVTLPLDVIKALTERKS